MDKHILKYHGFKTLLILACCSLLSACGGGGGGGGDFIGAAQVGMSASPTNIDTGDRMLVTVDISDVNENGIALKIRMPLGLAYVPSSSSIETDNQSFDISPAVNSTENNFRYLVYYLAKNAFGKGNHGTVKFFLEGKTRVIEGKLEVDADVDNPLILNADEFDIKNPDFAAEDEVEVRVEG